MSLPVYVRILASTAYIWAGFNTPNGFHLLCKLVGYFFLHTYLGCGIALSGYVKPVSFLSFFLHFHSSLILSSEERSSPDLLVCVCVGVCVCVCIGVWEEHWTLPTLTSKHNFYSKEMIQFFLFVSPLYFCLKNKQ